MHLRPISALLAPVAVLVCGLSAAAPALAAEDTGDTGSDPQVELQQWNSDDSGCSVLAAPAAAVPALLALVAVARRRED